jgi:ADP-ribose pyrophosphatase YjhB (NUDIX family)
VLSNRSVLFKLTILVKSLINPCVFGSTAIVQDGQGRVLLIRHSYVSGWQLPGGGMNASEGPEQAILRELQEEVGLVESTAPEFIGLYTRKILWVSNVIALYRVRNARIDFKPGLEVREAQFCDPNALPEGTTPATRRRIAEMVNNTRRAPRW